MSKYESGRLRAASSGLPSHVLRRLLNRHWRNNWVDLVGCTKGHVVETILDRKLYDEPWWGVFLDECRKEPRPPTAKQREARKVAERAKRTEKARALREEAESMTLEEAVARADEVSDQLRPLKTELAKLNRIIDWWHLRRPL